MKIVAEATLKQGHFAPCMVGALEAEFLKMMTFGLQAKDVLDVGTFTGKNKNEIGTYTHHSDFQP